MFPFGDKKEISLGQNRDKSGYEEIIDMNDGVIDPKKLGDLLSELFPKK